MASVPGSTPDIGVSLCCPILHQERVVLSLSHWTLEKGLLAIYTGSFKSLKIVKQLCQHLKSEPRPTEETMEGANAQKKKRKVGESPSNANDNPNDGDPDGASSAGSQANEKNGAMCKKRLFGLDVVLAAGLLVWFLFGSAA